MRALPQASDPLLRRMTLDELREYIA